MKTWRKFYCLGMSLIKGFKYNVHTHKVARTSLGFQSWVSDSCGNMIEHRSRSDGG